MLQNIPLNQLAPSPRNVRKTGGTSIADLAASIAVHGLLQNLNVTKPKGKGPYLVTSGQRRLSALLELVKAGKLPADLSVPCKLVDEASAGETSLAENVVRQAMHPADEFDAFKALADEGKTSDEISERFGCEPKHVEQRLRLAAVAPEILDEYRAGTANLEQMMALTLTTDHAAQRAVWKESAKVQWKRSPDNLRRSLTEKEVDGNSDLGKYVGETDYEAAGGTVRRDLFGEDIYFPDRKLLEEVALQKLQKTVTKVLKEGWKWGEARIDFDYSAKQKFGRAPSVWKGSKETYEPGTKAIAGVIVYIGYNGRAEVARGLVKPEDRKEAAKAAGGADKIKGGKTVKPSKAKKPGELPFAATQRLQVDATAIAQSALVSNPQRALAMLVVQLLKDFLPRNPGADSPKWINISRDASGRIPGMLRGELEESPYGAAMNEAAGKYHKLLQAKGVKPLEWALAQSTDTLLDLLAFLVAREAEDVDLYASAHSTTAQFAEAAGVDLAATWKPSVDWLSGLSRTTVIALVQEANGRKGKTVAAPLAKLKGEALAAAALPLLPAGWLPPPLRGPKARAKLSGKDKASGERDDAED